MSTKFQTAIKGGAVALAMLLATGCASLQNQVDALETRVNQLEQDSQAGTSSANAAAAEAMRIAEAAAATAEAALEAAAASQACCDATNEKIDRMFQRSQSK